MKTFRSTYMVPLLIVVAGVGSSLGLALKQQRENQSFAQTRLNDVTEQVADAIVERVQLYDYGLRGARGVVLTAGEEGLSRQSFRRYAESRDIDDEFPGARGFGYIRRVPVDREAAFLKAARADGKPDFAIRELGPHDGERYVIQYIEPVERNGAAVGLDIASEANRRRAADESIRLDATVITAPITLVQASGQKLRSFLILRPVYRPGMPIFTPQERRAAAHGWSYAALVMDEVLAAGLNLHTNELRVQLSDVTDLSDEDVFYETVRADRTRAAVGLGVRALEREVFGRRWRLAFEPNEQFMRNLRLTPPEAVGGIGAAVSVLTALIAALLMAGRARQREALESKLRTATIVDNASEAIVAQTLDGRVTHWNPAAATLFGRSTTEALGQPLVSLIVPEDLQREDADLLVRAAQGHPLKAFETVRLAHDGREIDVAVTPAPIKDAEGRVIGLAKLMHDITQRKRQERELIELNRDLDQKVRDRTIALEQTERDLRTVLDAVPSMIGYWDRNLVNRVANAAYHEWFGRPPGSLPGTTLRELLGHEVFGTRRTRIDAVLAGQAQSFDDRLKAIGDQPERQVIVHYIPDVREGVVHGFYSIVHDVTDLTRSKAQLSEVLRENEALLHTIKDQTIYSVADVHGTIIDINDRFCEISGYSRDELIGQNHRIISSTVHDKAFWREVWRTIAAGRSWRGQVCNRAKDGSLYWVDSIIAPFLGAEGKPERYISIRHDITAAVQAKEHIEAQRVRLDNILRGTNVGTWEWNVQTGETVFNERWAEIVGRRLEDLAPVSIETWQALAHPDDLAHSGEMLQAHFEGRAPFYECEARMRHADGRWIWVLDRGRVLSWTADGKPEWMFGTHMDITERHETAQALLEAKTAAEVASEAKTSFLANMSHEIRTPLNAIVGVTHLLADTQLDRDQRQLVEKTQIAARSLLGIVNDVLDLAKIEAGELALDEVTFQPRELAHEIEQVYGSQASEKGLNLEMDLADALPDWLLGDSGRLRQIVVNLLSNAIKFTAKGRVTLRLDVEPIDSRHVQLRGSVRDTGPGIDAQTCARLFRPFVQADATTTRRFGGTGLGLSIVQRLTQLMGGKVGVDSEVGVGSDFWFTIPFARPSLEEVEKRDAGHSTLDVVVADDVPSDRVAVTAIARSLGWRATACDGGRALVREVLQRRNETRRVPDVLIVDWRMPDMDGLSALGELAHALGKDQLPAALIVSAYEREQIAALDHAHLADAVLTKPVSVSALFNAVNEAVARRVGATDHVLKGTRMFNPSTRWLSGAIILLVDDSDINLDIACRLLEAQGAFVDCRVNGVEAVAAIRKHPEKYDAVLMDIQMPVMDGLAATRQIRQQLGQTSLPIIALTAGALGEERRRAMEAGMTDFLTKPLDPPTMIRTVRHAVEAFRGAAPKLTGSDGSKRSEASWPDLAGVHTRDAVMRLDGDLELFRNLLRRFVGEYADLAEGGLVVPQATEERRALAARVHKLRGTAGTLGAMAVHRLASDIEAGLLRDAPLDELPMAELTKAVKSLREATAAWLAGDPTAPAPLVDALDAQARAQLVEKLKRRDIEGVDDFERLASGLQSTMPGPRFAQLRQAMDDLDFDAALRALGEP